MVPSGEKNSQVICVSFSALAMNQVLAPGETVSELGCFVIMMAGGAVGAVVGGATGSVTGTSVAVVAGAEVGSVVGAVISAPGSVAACVGAVVGADSVFLPEHPVSTKIISKSTRILCFIL